MSTDPSKAKVVLRDIRQFIQNEPSYLSITSQHSINLDETLKASQTTLSNASVLGGDLAELFTTWNRLSPDTPDVLAEFMIRRMVVEINTCSEDVARLKKSTSDLNVAASEAIGKLEGVSQTLHTNLAREQEQIQKLQQSLNAIVQKINDLHSQLSGASGFWEGLKTGLSFGIYSGVRDRINQENAQRSLYDGQRQKLQRVSQQTQTDIDTISRVDPILRQTTSLDTSIVSLENIIQRLVALAQKTEHDGDRVTTTDNSKVAQFYRNRFDNDMTTLLEWKDVFS